MGTVATQRVYGLGGAAAAARARAEVHRLARLWSPHRRGNVIHALRAAAGKTPLDVDNDTLQLIDAGRGWALLTQGALDITCDPLIRLWRRAARTKLPPTLGDVDRLLPLVGLHHLQILINDRVYLPQPGQGLDLGSMGKGYAADRIRNLYREAGIRHAILNIGGNVMVVGARPGGKPWKIGVQAPRQPRGMLVGYVEAIDCAVVSSGDYEQYFVGPDASGGIRRFHHIIDPRTGWPADNGIAAVTIVAPSASQADALATAVLVLGLSQGMELCASLSDTHALIVDEDGSLHWSAGMSAIFTPISQREVEILG